MVMELSKKQIEAVSAIREGYSRILTGGSVSSGKTVGLAIIFLSLAMSYPKTRYGIFRKNRSVLYRTTYQSFVEIAEQMHLTYRENRSELSWTFANGSQIWFVELDETKDRQFNKVRGLELTAAGIDEANEVVEEAYIHVCGRVGRQNTDNGSGVPPAFVLLTCNPSQNWVKELFYNMVTDDKKHIFIRSLPSDNPHNSPEYLAALDEMPDWYRIPNVLGDWDYVMTEGALWTEFSYTDMLPDFDEIIMGVDPAVSSGEHSDETGIIISGIYGNQGIVLYDMSGRYDIPSLPALLEGIYEEYRVDRMVIETDQGGDWVTGAFGSAVNVEAVKASKYGSKRTRAMPVANLYDKGQIAHYGRLERLESQQRTWIVGSGKSPDRIDALVWSLLPLWANISVTEGFDIW